MRLHLQGLEIGSYKLILFKASINLSAKQFNIVEISTKSKSAAQSKELMINQSHMLEKSAQFKL